MDEGLLFLQTLSAGDFVKDQIKKIMPIITLGPVAQYSKEKKLTPIRSAPQWSASAKLSSF